MNHTPVEFISWGLSMKLKVFSVEIVQKEGEFRTKLLAVSQAF